MKIKFPLMILGYSTKMVFSTEDDMGHVCFPIFFDPEKAEAYRVFFAREHHQALEIYIIQSGERAQSFFRYLLTIDPGLQEVVVDPPPPVDGKKGGHPIPYPDFLEALHRQRSRRRRARRRIRRKTGDNDRPIHTKKD